VYLRGSAISISKPDMSDRVLRHLFTGFVRLHILYHAARQPICGVEIMDELRHHGYSLGPGTLYPVLHDLERAGLLRSQQKVVEGKRRRNFTITPRGRRLLAQARTKLAELAAEILYDQDALAARQQAAPSPPAPPAGPS
jgi:PadR family transcriptional regulator PadR